jgi:molecular chaperone HscA
MAGGVDRADNDFKYLNADLRRRIRSLKERLFLTGELVDRFSNDRPMRMTRETFVGSEGVQRFGRTLHETFHRVLERADKSFVNSLAAGGLMVVLTGGGATLPMVQALGVEQSRVHGQTLMHRSADLVPQIVISEYPELEPEYPQLAVSIGGASPDLLEEMRALPEFLGQAQPVVRLGGYYTKGR